jgi:hypothetical protein
MESTGCSKELTPPALVAANHAPNVEPAGADTASFPPVSALDPMLFLPGELDPLPDCPAPHSSPPFDRIIALCHFVI